MCTEDKLWRTIFALILHPFERSPCHLTSITTRLVIGAGQAGAPLSIALANAGWKVAIIERDQVGGTCVNRGCTPTKTMVARAEVAYQARRAADYGVHTGSAQVNLAEVLDRKRKVVE